MCERECVCVGGGGGALGKVYAENMLAICCCTLEHGTVMASLGVSKSWW